MGRIALMCLEFVIPFIFLTSIIGFRKKNANLLKLARIAVITQFGILITASSSLLYLLLTSDFRYEYVSQYTSRELSVVYRIAAFWGGNAGSLLFWMLILSLYMFIVTYSRHEHSESMLPVVTAIISFISFFFVSVLNFEASPFTLLDHVAENGNGLNPLLQNPGMTVHPVNLYLGYVGFVVPYAYSMAALILKKTDATWLKVTRRWTLISWLFLSCGIIYGARWSYEELGWGGYWAWDPIENASLMPWLAATAFLHSAMIQERKGMLKGWNVILITITYLLTLFGTALTRGGELWSIHAFSNGTFGVLFMSFVALLLVCSVFLILWRWPTLRADRQFEAVVSKESSFLLNNLLFMGALFAVFWGTVFPIVSEALTGNRMMVSTPFYNAVVLPIGVFLVLLMGIGPLLAWRRSSMNQLKKSMLYPILLSCVSLGLLYGAGVHDLLSLAAYISSTFVIVTIFQEFFKSVRARVRMTGDGIWISFFKLISNNRRKYGGYIVHLALVIMVIGFTSSGSYSKQITVNMKIGDQVKFGNFLMTYKGVSTVAEEGKQILQANMEVAAVNTGQKLGLLQPNVTFYTDGSQPLPNMGLYSTPYTDLYLILDATDYQKKTALFEIHLNPLVSFIWAGGYLYILGTFVSLWPTRVFGLRKRAKASTTQEAISLDYFYRELADLEYDYQMGKMDSLSYEQVKGELHKQVSLLKQSDHQDEILTIEMRVEREIQSYLTFDVNKS